MKLRMPVCTFAAGLLLMACGPGEPPVADAPPATQSIEPAPSANAAPSAQGDPGLAHWDGYGDIRFGMDAAALKQAWAGELDGAPNADEEPGSCYHLSPIGQPDQAHLAFMLEGGKFVRYSASNDDTIAPGGGKRGMTIDDIERLYPGKVEQQGHKYVEGGKYLRIVNGKEVLIFEADAEGKVTEWRVGREPQIDYVEGCS